jgi:hypothetical protein
MRALTLAEAERLRQEVEPLVIEAVEQRRRVVELEGRLTELVQRIQFTGGLAVDLRQAYELRRAHERAVETLRSTVERVEERGCLLKDLDLGLVDFPGRLNGEEIFWCWRLGEDRIRFWHRRDEGFAGRKPIFPTDAGNEPLVQ